MRAHKVPATYYKGWHIPNLKKSFYVFYKNDLYAKGLQKNFKKPKKFTTEHSYFMEEDFYYIDFGIKGIAYKLEDEITHFLNKKKYKIKCVDDLVDESDMLNEKIIPDVIIDSYEKFMRYRANIDMWDIFDLAGKPISTIIFQEKLNDYIFQTVGRVIEKDYFADYLEPMWNDIKKTIKRDISGLKTDDTVVMSRKKDFLEFFVIQYLRVEKRVKTDITPILEIFKNVFSDMGFSKSELEAIQNDGLLSPEPYFFGILLDIARGDKTRLNKLISVIDNNYVIDILEAPKNIEYITSTNPCIFSKMEGDVKLEVIFPVEKQYCIRLRKKMVRNENGKYFLQTINEVKEINSIIVKKTEDIVISSQEYIKDMIIV